METGELCEALSFTKRPHGAIEIPQRGPFGISKHRRSHLIVVLSYEERVLSYEERVLSYEERVLSYEAFVESLGIPRDPYW